MTPEYRVLSFKYVAAYNSINLRRKGRQYGLHIPGILTPQTDLTDKIFKIFLPQTTRRDLEKRMNDEVAILPRYPGKYFHSHHARISIYACRNDLWSNNRL
jgi:hypothetical protein